MAPAEGDIQFTKDHLGEWLAEQSLGKPPAVYELELRERMVRVEEELRHQRELMREGFAQMDQRHQELRQDMAARFEQVDRRLEQIDRRSESVQQDIREPQRRMDRFMLWSFGTTVGVGVLVVTLIKFWNPCPTAFGGSRAPTYPRWSADRPAATQKPPTPAWSPWRSRGRVRTCSSPAIGQSVCAGDSDRRSLWGRYRQNESATWPFSILSPEFGRRKGPVCALLFQLSAIMAVHAPGESS